MKTTLAVTIFALVAAASPLPKSTRIVQDNQLVVPDTQRLGFVQSAGVPSRPTATDNNVVAVDETPDGTPIAKRGRPFGDRYRYLDHGDDVVQPQPDRPYLSIFPDRDDAARPVKRGFLDFPDWVDPELVKQGKGPGESTHHRIDPPTDADVVDDTDVVAVADPDAAAPAKRGFLSQGFFRGLDGDFRTDRVVQPAAATTATEKRGFLSEEMLNDALGDHVVFGPEQGHPASEDDFTEQGRRPGQSTNRPIDPLADGGNQLYRRQYLDHIDPDKVAQGKGPGESTDRGLQFLDQIDVEKVKEGKGPGESTTKAQEPEPFDGVPVVVNVA